MAEHGWEGKGMENTERRWLKDNCPFVSIMTQRCNLINWHYLHAQKRKNLFSI